MLLVRGRDRARDLRSEDFRAVLKPLHPDPLAFDYLPLSEMMSMQMYPLNVSSWIGSILGGIALALSVTGLYGVLVYMLSQRTREIGIRMALGATASSVVRLVMTQSARLAGLGAIVGVVAAFSVMTLLRRRRSAARHRVHRRRRLRRRHGDRSSPRPSRRVRPGAPGGADRSIDHAACG